MPISAIAWASACVHEKGCQAQPDRVSDKIDRVGHRTAWLALPIFRGGHVPGVLRFVSWLGAIGAGWANDGVFGDSWFSGPGCDAYSEAVEEYEAAADEADAAGTELVFGRTRPA